MDKLDYELQHEADGHNNEEGIVFIPAKSGADEQADAVDFSKKVIKSLESILKAYNSEHSKKVKITQAKKMYCAGAKMYSQDPSYSANEWGLARVNLCLRIISGKIGELNLDISRKTPYNKLVDITDHLTPTNEDFQKAKQDTLDHGLDYHFDDVDELYLNEEPISYVYHY